MIGRTPAKKIALQIEYAQGKHDGLCICQTDLWPSTGRYADIPCMTSCWCMCASCWSSEHQKCICKHCPCKVFHADTTFDLEMIARRSGAGGQAARQTANRLFVIS